jgi:hypothetical protein
MTDEVTRITVGTIGIAIPVIFVLAARLATLRRSERKDERTLFIDKALYALHSAFMGEHPREPREPPRSP